MATIPLDDFLKQTGYNAPVKVLETQYLFDMNIFLNSLGVSSDITVSKELRPRLAKVLRVLQAQHTTQSIEFPGPDEQTFIALVLCISKLFHLFRRGNFDQAKFMLVLGNLSRGLTLLSPLSPHTTPLWPLRFKEKVMVYCPWFPNEDLDIVVGYPQKMTVPSRSTRYSQKINVEVLGKEDAEYTNDAAETDTDNNTHNQITMQKQHEEIRRTELVRQKTESEKQLTYAAEEKKFAAEAKKIAAEESKGVNMLAAEEKKQVAILSAEENKFASEEKKIVAEQKKIAEEGKTQVAILSAEEKKEVSILNAEEKKIKATERVLDKQIQLETLKQAGTPSKPKSAKKRGPNLVEQSPAKAKKRSSTTHYVEPSPARANKNKTPAKSTPLKPPPQNTNFSTPLTKNSYGYETVVDFHFRGMNTFPPAESFAHLLKDNCPYEFIAKTYAKGQIYLSAQDEVEGKKTEASYQRWECGCGGAKFRLVRDPNNSSHYMLQRPENKPDLQRHTNGAILEAA
jgi:hypothetical protein